MNCNNDYSVVLMQQKATDDDYFSFLKFFPPHRSVLLYVHVYCGGGWVGVVSLLCFEISIVLFFECADRFVFENKKPDTRPCLRHLIAPK
jgi:hypothetical protein